MGAAANSEPKRRRTDQDETVRRVSEAAEAAAREGDWPTVARLLRTQQTRLGPDDSRLMAEALRHTGRAAEALDWLRLAARRYPRDLPLALTLADELLAAGQPASALAHLLDAGQVNGASPALLYREARARFALGQALGETQVRPAQAGRAGQFDGEWLLIEARGPGAPHAVHRDAGHLDAVHRDAGHLDAVHRDAGHLDAGPIADPPSNRGVAGDRPGAAAGSAWFLCAPRASALYALRRAFDLGLAEPAAHVLHARIWLRGAYPDVALSILRSHEASWLNTADHEALAAAAEIAWSAGALSDFLRYTRRQAQLQPAAAAALHASASAALAEQFNQRGDVRLSAAFLVRALAHAPDDATLLRKLGDVEWSAGQYRAAQDCYRRALQLEPVHADRARLLRRLQAPPPDAAAETPALRAPPGGG